MDDTYDDYDHLKLCPICGDKETRAVICSDCARQIMIDCEGMLDDCFDVTLQSYLDGTD